MECSSTLRNLCQSVELHSGPLLFERKFIRTIVSSMRFLWSLPTELLAIVLWISWRSQVVERGKLREAHVFLLRGRRRGLSLGRFIFIWTPDPQSVKGLSWEDLLTHEYGHTVQALYLGPFYLLIVGLPSLTWAGLPALKRYRRNQGVSYYKLYTESWADRLGQRVLGRRINRL